jgi:hypothetical protein
MHTLVRELASTEAPVRVSVAVSCRVLGLARQPYYRWLEQRVTDAELEKAYRVNALRDTHRDDPEFGYQFLLDEVRDAGEPMADRTARRICSDNGWWSAFEKKARGRGRRSGRRSTMTWSAGTSLPRHRTNCGSGTLRRGTGEGHCTSARSRTSTTPTGSSATRSSPG